MAGQGSARVSLKEIDLSRVREPEVLPEGVPAAVVGPAKRGPAFVPKTFANMQQFGEVFGSMQERSKESNANRFGPLALNEWMRNAQAGTFLKVLGVGDSEGRMDSTTKKVAGAGFVVGDKVSHDEDSNKLQDNPFAKLDGSELEQASKAARTHFLGCFMRDTDDSTFLQDAGVQTASAAGVVQIRFAALPSNGDFITLEFVDPTDASQTVTKTFEFTGVGDVSIDGAVAVNQGGNVDATATALKNAIQNDVNVGIGGFNVVPTIISDAGAGVDDPHTVEILQSASGELSNTSIVYKFNPADGDINSITVNNRTSSDTTQEYKHGVSGDVAGTCIITINDNPVNNSSIVLNGLKNDGDAIVTTDEDVTFTFVNTEIPGAADNGSDGVGGRYQVTAADACNVHIADTKQETLRNLAAAINRPSSNTAVAVLDTSDLLVATLFDNDTKLRVTQANSGADSIECVITLSGTETNLVVSAGDDQGAISTLTSTGVQSGRFINGRDGSSSSFELALSSQPIEDEELQIEVLSDPDTPTVVAKTLIFKAAGVNGADAGAGKITVVIGADVEETLANIKAAIVGADAAGGLGIDLQEVAASMTITTSGNGNAASSAATAGQKIALQSHDGTKVVYILTNSAHDGQATGEVLQNGDVVDSDANATAAVEEGEVGIAVQINVGTTTQGALLAELKSAIDEGPQAGKLSTGAVANQNNGAASATLEVTQVVAGFNGNTAVTDGMDDITVSGADGTPDVFEGGLNGFNEENVTIFNDRDAIEFKQTQNISLKSRLTSSFAMSSHATIKNPDRESFVGNVGQKTSAFEGGGGSAAPIIRGLLMTPQGVIPALKQSNVLYKDFAAVSKVTLNNTSFKDFGAGGVDLAGYQIGSIENSQDFTLILNGFDNSEESNTLSCSFNPEDVNYFANVLNTDPTQLEERGHYLHMHWDIDATKSTPSAVGLVNAAGNLSDLSTAAFCMSTKLNEKSSTTDIPDFESYDTRFRTACSPWFVSQDFGGQNLELFKLHALDDGEFGNDRFRILVSNVAAPESSTSWGTFDLTLEAFDSDPIVGEALVQWKRLSLDPNSRNFIGRVIGTKHMYFDFDRASSSQRLVEEGDYEVRNKYVRVELSPAVELGEINRAALVSGFKGYRKLNTEASSVFREKGTDGSGTEKLLKVDVLDGASVLPLPLIKSISRSNGQSTEASEYIPWGIKFSKYEKVSEINDIRFNKSIKSWTTFVPDMVSAADQAPASVASDELFTLEKVAVSDPSDIDWSTSVYARDGVAPTSKSFISLSDAASVGKNVKFLKFRCLMQGGFDGVNIFDKQKAELTNVAAFREANDEVNDNKFTGPTVVAYKKAIDVLADKSATEFQLLAIPGLREPLITDYAMTACESRFDAMFVMDIEEANNEGGVITSDSVRPDVGQTTKKFAQRRLDTSFAAAYFPDVVIRRTSNGSPLQVPPSVGMLGVMSLNDTLADPWFAPAGTTRGRLNALHSKVQMNREVLNDLYDEDINPIYEPAGRAGEVFAFGQKTLMQNPSALDRINVRRLLINLRRRVKSIANTLLFEPNRASTLARFSALVEPIMAEVQARQGVERYKVQIDTTTTTQNDVENNTIRGKIYLQPTKSVEFISLDFVVTNSID